jgi:hypothetical protein
MQTDGLLVHTPEQRAGASVAVANSAALTIVPRVVLRSLLMVIGFLVVMHLLVQVAVWRFGRDHLLGVVPLFDLNREGNIPTWYSAGVLLITGVALGLVAVGKRQQQAQFARHWAVLGAMFLYLSFDELMRVHEFWGAWLDSSLGQLRSPAFLGGAFAHLWIVPAVVLVLVVGLTYIRFLQHLPPSTRTLFMGSGLAFIVGAVGFEMLDGIYAAAAGRRNLTFEMLVAAEESLEMTSIAVFLYAVLTYLGDTFSAIQISPRRAE